MPDEVVSGATETAQPTVAVESPSSTSTQTSSEPATPAAPRYSSLQDVFKDHPELETEYHANTQRVLSKAQRRWQAAQVSRKADSALTNEDADGAFEALREARTFLEPEPDETEQRDADFNVKADRVQPLLNDLFELDGQNRATNPHYIALHNREGQAKMDARYNADPEAFYKWASKEMRKIEVQEELKRIAPDLYAAAQTDAEHQALQARGVPPTGGAGSGGMSDDDFIKAYSEGRADDHKRAQTILRKLS